MGLRQIRQSFQNHEESLGSYWTVILELQVSKQDVMWVILNHQEVILKLDFQ